MSEHSNSHTGVPVEDKPVILCDICGHEVIEWNCELICPNCGARRDCSDP